MLEDSIPRCLLLIAFIVNILLVRFNKITKCRTLITTGHVQVQQAATAYWLIMFALPGLLSNNVALMVVMAVILGSYWAVGSNLTVKPMQELTDGAGFAIAHQQMFGILRRYHVCHRKRFLRSSRSNKGNRELCVLCI